MNPLAALLATLGGAATGQAGGAQQSGAPAAGGLFAAMLEAANGIESGLPGEAAANSTGKAAVPELSQIEDLAGLLGQDVETLILAEQHVGEGAEAPTDGEAAAAGDAVGDVPPDGELDASTLLSGDETPQTDDVPATPIDGAAGTGETGAPQPVNPDGTAQPATTATEHPGAVKPSAQPESTAAGIAQDDAARSGRETAGPGSGERPGGRGSAETADAHAGQAPTHASRGTGGQPHADADGNEGPARPAGPTDAETTAARLQAEARAEERRILPSAEQRTTQSSETRAGDQPQTAAETEFAKRDAYSVKSDASSPAAPQKSAVLKAATNAATGQALLQLQEQPDGETSPLARGDGQTLSVQLRPAASNAPQTPAPQAPVQGLAVQIAQQAQNGARRFEIRMDPPELGRVEVRLDVARDGQVTTHLIVERSETLDLLQRDARSLERALQDAGLNTSEDGMKFSLKDQGLAQGEGQDADEESARGAGKPDEDTARSDEDQPPPEHYIATTGLDIRI